LLLNCYLPVIKFSNGKITIDYFIILSATNTSSGKNLLIFENEAIQNVQRKRKERQKEWLV
jgi:hypothetical protein